MSVPTASASSSLSPPTKTIAPLPFSKTGRVSFPPVLNLTGNASSLPLASTMGGRYFGQIVGSGTNGLSLISAAVIGHLVLSVRGQSNYRLLAIHRATAFKPACTRSPERASSHHSE